MQIVIERYRDTGTTTFGKLRVNGIFECYTLEDTYHAVKIPGQTRIPAGEYRVRPRFYGRFFDRYTKRFPWHKGTLELLNVPNFSDILIHTGNTIADTAGCILVGRDVNETNEAIALSAVAYEALYKKVYTAACNDALTMQIEDERTRHETRHKSENIISLQ